MNLQPTASVARRLARELDMLQARLKRLEAAIGTSMTPEGPRPRGERLGALQEMDFLSQSLADLSAFLDELCESAPPAQVIDISAALARLRLGALAARLSGTGAEETSASITPSAIDLF